MIIGEFNDSFPPLMDGVGGVVKNYTLQLKKQGDTVYVLAGGYENSDEYDKQMGWDYVYRMPAKEVKRIRPYGILKCPQALFDQLMAIDFDLIHIHSPFYAGSVGRKIALAKHIPLVGTFHTLYADDINLFVHNIKPLTDLVLRKIMRNYYLCDEVWTPSSSTRKVLITDYNFKKDVQVMENGCDMVVPSSQERAEMKKKAYDYTGIKEDMPVVIYVGQHKDAKNLPLVLQSLAILRQKGIPFRMLFVGEGPQAEDYKKFVKSHDMESYVSFLGKITDRTLVASLYCISSLFLFPSLYDTSCLVMREAACFKLPVAFIKDACTSEGIIDGDNGYLSENTPQAFSDTIYRAIINKEEHDHVGLRARESLYHSWEEVLTQVKKRYENLVATHGNGHQTAH
ncbi:MAG: glycosyltransferase [Sphaerochaetaceae bacterium]